MVGTLSSSLVNAKFLGLVPAADPWSYMTNNGDGSYTGQCYFPWIRDQSQDPFCNGVADRVLKVCDDFNGLDQAISDAGGWEALCTSLGYAAELIPGVGLAAGPITAGVCVAAYFGLPLLCNAGSSGTQVYKQQYCTAPSQSITLNVKVSGYGQSSDPSTWTQSDLTWKVGDLPPPDISLVDVDSRLLGDPSNCLLPPDQCDDAGLHSTPWSTVYAGNLIPGYNAFEGQDFVPYGQEYGMRLSDGGNFEDGIEFMKNSSISSPQWQDWRSKLMHTQMHKTTSSGAARTYIPMTRLTGILAQQTATATAARTSQIYQIALATI
jgi:hypothetical protein